jgi:hypothetical protein
MRSCRAARPDRVAGLATVPNRERVSKRTTGRGEMQSSGLRQGQAVAAGGGLLLIISLFLPWFGAAGAESLSGWEGQTTDDIYLLITALVALGALALGGGAMLPGLTWSGATALLGGVATILMLWLVVIDFPDGGDRKIGLFLGLLAVLVIAAGGFMATMDDAPSTRSERY